jgi:hypothetical protein
MISPEVLAQTAYSAYGSITDYKNYRGEPMPAWDDLPDQIKRAWMSAANAVAAAALAPTAKPLVPWSAVEACRHCGFIWPPGIAARALSCPGCQQAYEG